MKVYEQNDNNVTFGYDDNQAKLEFKNIGIFFFIFNMIKKFLRTQNNFKASNKFNLIGTKVDHGKAYGRIAFSVPYDSQPGIQKKIRENGHKILTDLITLDTPGKASVRVIILADPVSPKKINYMFIEH